MSFTTETSVFIHPGDGTATAFVVSDFLVYEAEQLVISARDASDVVTALVLGVDYTVVVATPLPGLATVTPLASIAVGTDWICVRDTPKTQTLGYSDSDTFPSDAHEEALDRAMMVGAELEEQVSRTVRQDLTEDPLDLTIPRLANRSDKLFYWDANGQPTAVDLATLSPGSVALSALSEILLPLSTAQQWQVQLQFVRQVGSVQVLAVDVDAAEPSGGSVADFLFLALDTGRMSSNVDAGATVSDVGHLVVTYADADFPVHDASLEGKLLLNSDTLQLFRQGASAITPVRTFDPWHIAGLVPQTAGGTSFLLIEGSVRDAADTVGAALSGLFNKTFNTAGDWAEGSGANSVPAAVIAAGLANKPFPIFAIFKPDGTMDFGVDTSAAWLTAANLLNVAGAAWAAGYRTFRRIGWLATDGTPALIGMEYARGIWYYRSPRLVHTATGQNLSVGYTATLTHVPIRVGFIGTVMYGALTANEPIRAFGGVLTSPAAPSLTVASGAHEAGGASNVGAFGVYGLITNNDPAELKLRVPADTSVDVHIVCDGWIDDRIDII